MELLLSEILDHAETALSACKRNLYSNCKQDNVNSIGMVFGVKTGKLTKCYAVLVAHIQ